jgi:hypothetical protein
VGDRREQTAENEAPVTPAELRAPDLPLQPLGGYSRTDTNLLLTRAAKTLEATESGLQSQISSLKAALDAAHERLSDQASREPVAVEQAVGEVLVTAHHAADVVRAEAKEEADALLAAARAQAQDQAQEIVREAERRTEELRAANGQIEDAIARARDEARLAREDAVREIAELRGEARRVRSVINDFRTQWWHLIQDALRQLESGLASEGESGDGADGLEGDLRERLAAPRPEDTPQTDQVVEPQRTGEAGSGAG